MPKVQCGKCQFWQNRNIQRLKRGAMFSLSHNYEYVGYCMNDEAGANTSGYTGNPRGHKMSRREKAWRHCRFFKPIQASDKKPSEVKKE